MKQYIFQVFNFIPINVGTEQLQGIGFHIQCPGYYSSNPAKLIMLNNGTVSENSEGESHPYK